MSILTYCKTNRGGIYFFVTLLVIVNFFLLVSTNFNKSLGDILYLNFLLFLSSAIFLFTGYLNWRSRYGAMRKGLDHGEKIDTLLPEDDSFPSQLFRDLVKNKNLENEKQNQETRNALDEISDYITKWVHEVKAPVSVCELLLEKSDHSSLSMEMQRELEKIKFLTNQVLYISRSSSYAEDLAVHSIRLEDVVKQAIRRNSTLLISKNIEVEIANLNYEVLSDEKWIAYVLDQLLHNAYKYTQQDGKITIQAAFDVAGNIDLIFRDNGIGILPGDISRVFDKSFTGNNKSNLSRSTGMGLYISRKMLDKLGHRIEVQSEPGVYTEFKITFFRITDLRVHVTEL